MKKLLLSLLLLAMPASTWAALVLELSPAGGAVSGNAGSVIGLGFTLTVTGPDTNVYAPTGIQICLGNAPAVCSTVPANSPPTLPGVLNVTAPLNSTLLSLLLDITGTYSPNPSTEVYDELLGTGLARIEILPTADAQTLPGTISVIFDVFDSSLTPLAFNQMVSAPISISVVPEPGTTALVAAGLAGLVALQRRRNVR